MGYLTTRKEEIKLGHNHEPSILLDHFKKWVSTRNLNISGADVKNWDKRKGS